MADDTLISNLIQHLSKRLNLIEKRHAYLSFLVKKRFANEKLLQLETMHIISQMSEVEDYLPEKLYGFESKEKCDFWFKLKDGAEFWIEIKMRPTNYRKPGHAKAITNGVAQVVEDIQRLKKITDRNTRRFAMFAFYPIYAESYRTFNEIHLKRISQEAGKNIENPMITVNVREADFNLYVVEV